MDVRRVWREHRRLADVTVCAAAAALTILVSRAAWGSLSPYPQPSAAAFADRLLPVGVLVLVRGIGMPLLACGLLLGRRRHPVAVAVVLLLLSPFLPVLVPLLVALFTTARTRPPRTTAWISAAALWPVPVQLLLSPSDGRVSVAAAVSAVACVIGAVGWGQYVAGLQDRARRAEAEADLRARQARQHVREEIAREMHDVLAHRLTLLSMHAGALEFHPGAPPALLAEAAGVVRQSAGRALEDLQDVLRVLRAPTVNAHAEPPQPTVRDLPRLIEEARSAGAEVRVRQDVDDVGDMSPAAARTAYRVVQEALTNHRKHAPAVPLLLTLSGGPALGLTITAANPAQQASGRRAGATGQGLIGMQERVGLAGGRMSEHRTAAEFRIEVWLPWTG